MYTHFKNIPVLVTGGCGFIGSHLAHTLVNHGARVTIIDDLSTGTLSAIEKFKHQITFIQESITNIDACMRACANQEIVFHQAAYISVPGSLENPTRCHEINVRGTYNMLEAARVHHLQRFVFASSAAVYGQREGICHETMQPNPTSPYGFSKLMNELYAQHYTELFNLHTIGLRYFNVHGPNQNPHGAYAPIVTKLRYHMAHNLPITIFGDGTQTRDFIHVQDIVQANLTLASLDPIHTKGQLFNIATGTSISLLTLIEQLKKEYPAYSESISFAPKRTGDVTHSHADCSRYNAARAHLRGVQTIMTPAERTIQIE